ncbi:long-chain-fatty-acid--CoA ligase [Bacillus tianshenii]|nr:long-chain-fatty-acid--CoA ligase [Bacillus tianshenii]
MFDVGYFTRRVTEKLNTLNPGKTAVQMENEQSWTYEELHLRSNAYGNALVEMGVTKGDRVGVLLYNCLEYFALYFAIAKIGAIAVRLNFRLTAPELEYVINDSGAKVLCFHSELNETISSIRNKTSVEHFICFSKQQHHYPNWAEAQAILDAGSTKEIDPGEIKLEDPVMLMYTSGTTGLPKGALWTHGNTFWFSSMQAMQWNYTGNEIAMTTGPLYHVGAMEDIALPTLLSGGTVHITKSGGFDISRILQVIDECNITDCFLFPFMIYEMLNSSTTYQLNSLKRIYTGGDPIMPWAIEQLNAKFPHIGLVQVYGLTEGTPIAASLSPEDNRTKSHTVGKAMPLTEIRIVNDNHESIEAGEIGEIAIKSPSVSTEYWNKPEATAETFVNGWCHTGDLGQIDEDGFLTIAGRKKDMIRSGGENVYAAEIEDLLYRHEKIKEVSIIGVPHPKYIETVCAIIVKQPNVSLPEEEVIHYCQGKIAKYKHPRKIIFVDELPRTPSGKVQKFKLRERYQSIAT